MKKVIKVVNPRHKKNPILFQSPIRRIKKTGSYAAKNPGRKRKVSTTNNLNGKETPAMAAPKKKTHHGKHHNPVVFANKRRHHVRRHRNPESGVQMSGQGITSIFMDGLIVGGSMVGVNWLTNFIQSKVFPDSTSPWMKYALMAGVSLLGGWAVSKANSRVGKDFAVAGIGLTILNIANEQLSFLKLGTSSPLKGDYDEPGALGELTLGQLAEANAFKDNLLGQTELIQGDELGALQLVNEDLLGDDDLDGTTYDLSGAGTFAPSFAPGVSY
jgi:hypothetical protein